jgi:hypothetical protein
MLVMIVNSSFLRVPQALSIIFFISSVNSI